MRNTHSRRNTISNPPCRTTCRSRTMLHRTPSPLWKHFGPSGRWRFSFIPSRSQRQKVTVHTLDSAVYLEIDEVLLNLDDVRKYRQALVSSAKFVYLLTGVFLLSAVICSLWRSFNWGARFGLIPLSLFCWPPPLSFRASFCMARCS